jgi:hypothetical protein
MRENFGSRHRCVAVWNFALKPVLIGIFTDSQVQRRMLDADRPAEGEELESNIL